MIAELIRAYTLRSPLRKGKSRLVRLARRFPSGIPDEALVALRDGRRLSLSLRSARVMGEPVWFMGEYEPRITQLVRRIVKRGDVCLDLGANFGWYTTLLALLCGPSGSVHAFEPVPQTFKILKRNITLAGRPGNVFINRLAVGDAERSVDMHVFPDLPDGHSSISPQGRTDYSIYRASMIALDSYLSGRDVKNVAFVKCDVEGAELPVLRGSSSLFLQPAPPLWIIEMAIQTARPFGYTPNDLIEFMRSRADYRFYAIDERSGALRPVARFASGDEGANVLCVPRGCYEERLAKIVPGGIS